MKRTGFTLLELVIAMAISSILAIALFTSFYQINRSSRLVEQTISIDMRASILENLLEKDISGVFVPKIDEPKKHLHQFHPFNKIRQSRSKKNLKRISLNKNRNKKKNRNLKKRFFILVLEKF